MSKSSHKKRFVLDEYERNVVTTSGHIFKYIKIYGHETQIEFYGSESNGRRVSDNVDDETFFNSLIEDNIDHFKLARKIIFNHLLPNCEIKIMSKFHCLIEINNVYSKSENFCIINDIGDISIKFYHSEFHYFLDKIKIKNGSNIELVNTSVCGISLLKMYKKFPNYKIKTKCEQILMPIFKIKKGSHQLINKKSYERKFSNIGVRRADYKILFMVWNGDSREEIEESQNEEINSKLFVKEELFEDFEI